MATYVLVHGAWHGGWCWGKLRPLLEARGQVVHTPTLSGQGERAHQLSPAIDLATHIRDILGLITAEGLDEVVLVGHSYGGMVISGVAARIPERLRHLVYLDAFVPRDGESVFDLVPADFRQRQLDLAKTHGDGWRIPPPPLARYGVTVEEDVRWAGVRMTEQPLLTLTQAVRCADDPHLPRTYIACTDFDGPFTPFAERAQAGPGWRYRPLAAGHDAMITTPDALAALLLEVSET